jgi:isoleucyl-tRNA synthetase
MYEFKITEKEIREFWKKKKILENIRKNLKGKKKFYFLDGPPYTSGRIHMGTAWNQVLKDEILRYKRMRNFDVWDRGGYDMHGLPTENAVQKKLNIKDKKEIENYGVDKFVRECKNFSLDMMKKMNEDFDKLAVSLDHENPYMPISQEFIEGEWWLIKKAYEKNRLYLGKKVVTWCPNCETSLAKHELEYKNVEDESIFVKFKIENKKNEYLIIWTTTPWTIPYNLGVMVNPEYDYARVKVGEEVWIIAKQLVESVISKFTENKSEIIEELKGKSLENIRYEPPFYQEIKDKYDEIKNNSKRAFSVVLSKDFVNLEAGTGLVHMAPGCGPEDYEVGKEYGIPAFNNLTEEGNYPEDMGKFSGLNAKRDNKKFIEFLEEKGNLVAREKVIHEYAHCWRCNNPVIFRATEQWFFKIEDLIPDMIKQTEKVKYIPEEIKERYQLWIKNLKDNSITRQRYWGAPLPIWKCENCDNYKVIGSSKELKKLSGKLPEEFHIPWIDKIKIKCEKCGGEMKRITDVIDVWVDSGTASWNCLYYPEKKKFMKKFWPADLVLEATEQTRLWFYMLQLTSNLAFEKNCFENMYTHGMIRDFQGIKMSKSLGNIISPEEVLNKYGVDALRLYTITNKSGEDMNFSWEEIKLKYRELNILLNTVNYLLNYIEKIPDSYKNIKIEDKWILSRLNSTIKNSTEFLDNYQLDKAPQIVEELFLDLSRRYIKITRDRTNNPVVFKVIFETLFAILKMLSITCPYISEKLYLELKEKYNLEKESISMYSWPKAEKKRINKKLEKNFEKVFEIIEKGLSERTSIGIGLKWPLAKAVIFGDLDLDKESKEVIKNQLNIKKIEIKKGKEINVKLDNKLTPELEAEGYAREISRQIQAFRKNLNLQKKDRVDVILITDEELKKILEKQKEFLKEKTNSRKLEIVTTDKERFKNKIDFRIKDKKGEIVIIK